MDPPIYLQNSYQAQGQGGNLLLIPRGTGHEAGYTANTI